MAKKMRRLLALTMALILVAGQTALPALADTVDIENGTKSVDVAVNGNTETVTTVISTVDPATGNTYDSTDVTVTVSQSNTDPNTGNMSSNVDKSWDTDINTSEVPVTGADGTTVSSSTSTEVTGSETREDKIANDYSTNTQIVSGSINGSEDSETTKEIVSTNTQEDQLIGEATIVDADQTENLPTSSDPGADLNDEDSWTYGDPSVKQDWTGEGIVKGDEPNPNTEGKLLDSSTSTETPDDPGATLNLKPNGNWVTETVEVSLEEASNGKYDLFDTTKYNITRNKDGSYTMTSKNPSDTAQYTVVEKKSGGNVTGWTVTKRTESAPEATTKTPVTPGAGDGWTQVGQTSTVVGTDSTLENKAALTNGTKLADNKVEYVTKLYEDGKFVGYEIKVVTIDESDADSTAGSNRPTEVSTGDLGQANGYLLPTKPAEGTTTNADGTKSTVTATELYENGTLVGYTVVTENFDANGNPVSTETRELKGTPVTAPTQENSGFVLPAKPAESSRTDFWGTTTKVTVTDLIENGIHVGYTVLTEVTSEGGAMIRKETRNVYGTHSSTEVEVVKDPTTEEISTHTKVTTTEIQKVYITDNTRTMEQEQTYTQNYDTTILTEKDNYQLIGVGNEKYFIYKGVMYQVTSVKGDTNLTAKDAVKPNWDLVTDPNAGTDLYDKNPSNEEGYYASQYGQTPTFTDEYPFKIVGNGAASSLTTDGSNIHHQFMLVDEHGNKFFVYCADMGTSVRTGHTYHMENIEDANYYQGEDAVDHIKAIATNGFWGTTSGTGSLKAIQDLLKAYGYNSVANSITEGEALSATQAALWVFANSDDNDLLDQNNPVDGNNTNVKTLLNLLISDKLKNDTKNKWNTDTDILDAGDVIGGTITVKDAVTKADGSDKTVGGKTVYNTDVSFSLSVTKNELTGNLVVTLTQNGKPVDTINLKTADSNILGKLISGGKEVGSTITFRDVELIEGVEFDITISGKQDLKEGVYLYTASGGYTTAQTFVGIASGKQDVSVSMKMQFTVEDPEVKNTNTLTETHRQDTQKFTRVNQRTDTARVTKTEDSGNILTQKTHQVDIYGDVTVTETETEKTKENRKWESYWTYLLDLVREEEEKKEDTILDEEVPLADAPKTGDISGLWAAISLISLGGAAMLSIKHKEEA